MNKINLLINQLNEEMKKKLPLLKGSLYKTKNKCVNKNCEKCRSGKKHLSIRFTFKDQNNVRTSTTVNVKYLGDVKKLWENHKNFACLERKLRREMTKYFQKLKNYKEIYIISIRDYLTATKKSAKK